MKGGGDITYVSLAPLHHQRTALSAAAAGVLY